MAEKIDDITVNYEEGGQQLVKELDKEILTRGAWTTILFRYQQWDNAKQEFGPEKFSIRRYQKVGGEFMPKSKFTISSPRQAKQIIETLSRWTEGAEQ